MTCFLIEKNSRVCWLYLVTLVVFFLKVVICINLLIGLGESDFEACQHSNYFAAQIVYPSTAQQVLTRLRSVLEYVTKITNNIKYTVAFKQRTVLFLFRNN